MFETESERTCRDICQQLELTIHGSATALTIHNGTLGYQKKEFFS
jgi:hypothetical protein